MLFDLRIGSDNRDETLQELGVGVDIGFDLGADQAEALLDLVAALMKGKSLLLQVSIDGGQHDKDADEGAWNDDLHARAPC